MMQNYSWTWGAFGLFAQSLFFMRFALQWIRSERAGQSVMPVGFWWFSLLGGIGMTIYAVHQKDPVFTLGQGAGLIVYSRNLMMIYRRPKPVEGEPFVSAGAAGE